MPTDSTASPPDPGAGDERLLIVEVAGGLYGIDGSSVREIVGVIEATRLPGAPPFVRGLVNLRGQLLTVVDVGHRLMGTPSSQSPGSIVVVTVSERVMGLQVEDVHDVQDLPIIPAEREVLARTDGLLTGVGRLGDEVVLVIDIPELVRQTLT